MIKLNKREVKQINDIWFSQKDKLPSSIRMTVSISNDPNESDDIILYNTELEYAIISFNSNKDINTPKKLEDILKAYNKDHYLKFLKPYLRWA